MSTTQPLPINRNAAVHSMRCASEATISHRGVVDGWIRAAHLTTHSPDDVVALGEDLADQVLLAADVAAGWATALAPEITVDLQMVSNVITAAQDQPVTRLHAALVSRIIDALHDAALTFSTTAADGYLVGELDAAAIDLIDRLAEHRDGQRTGDPTSALPLLRISADPEPVTEAIDKVLVLVSPPLLIATPPEHPNVDIGGRLSTDLMSNLSGMPAALAEVEAQARQELARLQLTARPLPIADDATLDRLADIIVEADLARLQATHLAETLATIDDVDLLCWATATGERIITRTTRLAEHLTQLLVCFAE